MTLTLITDRREVTRACQQFQRALARGTARIPATIGYHGGQEHGDVHWSAARGFWSRTRVKDDRYWCAFGTDDPEKGRQLSITVEINPPLEGVNRRLAGMFAEDARGRVYVAHSGGVGGGRPGIGKKAFLQHAGGPQPGIAAPDGATVPALVIGRLGGPRFIAQLARFIRLASEFKRMTTAGAVPSAPLVQPYTPEFTGPRRAYRVADEIEAQCDHGLVVDAMKAECDSRGLSAARDVPRDLYLLDRAGRVTTLFEVKTDQSTGSLYGAVGQLLYHTAGVQPRPRCVAVLPGTPVAAVGERLAALGIAVVSYTWKGDLPVFSGLAPLLDGMKRRD
jgi:hypothetical protein